MNLHYIRAAWQNQYDLIDSGNFEKLERFGDYIIARPEPQALWSKSLPDAEWQHRAHARFVRHAAKDTTAEKGTWTRHAAMPEQWWIRYQHHQLSFKMRLGLTAFQHVGIFPEQCDNWNFIYDTASQMKQPAVLNLFAYTGAATLAARAAGAQVWHLDSVRQVVHWAGSNAEANGWNDIHRITEDALKFVRREAKRGKVYQGIVLDPPAYGRGTDGEKWEFEKNIDELLFYCAQLLAKRPCFLVMNFYSMGFSALVVDNLIAQHFPFARHRELGEIYFEDSYAKKLPLGTYLRFKYL